MECRFGPALYAKTEAVSAITLHVRRSNKKAHKLYVAFRYEEVDRRGKYNDEDEKIAMKKQVRQARDKN